MIGVCGDITKLPEHDRRLVEKALHCNRDYFEVWELMRMAETSEAKEMLHLLGSDYYHADERDLL